jgi:hypothetical protein
MVFKQRLALAVLQTVVVMAFICRDEAVIVGKP